MKKLHIYSISTLCFVLFLVHLSVKVSADSGQLVENLLPSPGFAEGWAIREKIAKYSEKDLYKYINGEAELYYPYGFKALATATYVRSDDPDTGIVADIYEMGSPIDAFGIYSRYRDPDEEQVGIGTEGFVNESQLLFAKDRYFIRLSPSGKVVMDKAVFLLCARSIAKRIPDATLPKSLDIIKIPETVPNTETYIAQGVLGYAFFKKGLSADAQLDGNTIRTFVVIEGSSESATQAFEAYKAYLEKSQAELSVSKDHNTVTIIARDPLYKGLALLQSGPFLLGAAKLADPARAIPILKKMQSRIPVM